MFCTEIQIRANLCRKWANEQDFVRGSSFFTKFHRFSLQKAIFSTISVLVLVFFFCARIQICANLCSFLIGNGSTSRTPQEVYRFSAKFYRFGLQKGIFSKILVSVVILFCARIQIQANLYSFSIGNGLTSRTPQDAHHFSAKFHRFGLRNGIFFKSFILLLVFFFLLQNSNWHKFVQFFDQKWVNEQDSIKGLSFFGQILSFRSMTWHFFFENFHFGAHFFAPKFRFPQICTAF